MSKVLIYGASGFMGKLTAQTLLDSGITPTLAGRSSSVERVADRLGCPAAVCGIDDLASLRSLLANVDVVLNLASPFELTQQGIVSACIATGTHYVDIAGEVNEMKRVYRFREVAEEAGVMLMPGGGFGVVPTDIVANLAKALLPDATRLSIAYATVGGVTRGTLKTVLGSIDTPGIRVAEGAVVDALPAESDLTFQVAGETFSAVYNPWRADLFTAAISTGILNISTFATFPNPVVSMMRGRFLWLRDLALPLVLRVIPEGPSEKQMAAGATYVAAVVDNGKKQVQVALKGPEAYLFTALCLREITAAILGGDWEAGFKTPAFYGADILSKIPGIEWD